MRLLCSVVGILAWQSAAYAGPILQLSYIAPPGAACASTSSYGAGTAMLTIDSCGGSDLGMLLGSPFLTATAQPLEVRIDGYPGAFWSATSNLSAMAIGALSEFDGSMTPLGGSGKAFLEFDIRSFGANDFSAEFDLPQFGIEAELGGFGQHRHYTVPVSFGDPISYSLQVQHLLSTGDPDVMQAGIGIYDIQVVDASGAAIPGVSVMEAPEPGTLVLLCAAIGLLVVTRFRDCR